VLLSGQSILVTGAGGFIGSHLVERLVEEGAAVRAFVHYNSRNDPGLLAHLPDAVMEQVELRAGDLRDPQAIRESVKDTTIVFHLGALISIPYSYQHPYEVAETKLPVVTIRPFNTYGPRQSDRAVVPTIITQALTKEKIFLGNLEARRDLTFVTDTVDGFLKAGVTQDVEGQVFNLGTGLEVSIGDLAKRVLAQTGKDVEIEVDPDRLRPDRSEVQRLIADSTKAREALGWEPKVTLDEGLKNTIEWIRENIGNFQVGMYRF